MFTFEEGEEEYENGNYEKAFKIYITLAESGDIRAQISIACMYASGEGIQQNSDNSIEWLRLAAEQGHPLAQNNLAVALLHSDLKEAMKWLIKAADNNFPFAQWMLADIYFGMYEIPTGIRDLKDIPNALKWYKKAGEEGDCSYAYYRLGKIFSNGQEVEKDEQQAFNYYLASAKSGYQPSQEVLGNAYREGMLGLAKDLERSQYWINESRQRNGIPLSD